MKLHQLDSNLRKFLATFLCVMTIGVTVGLIYVQKTTNISTEGTVHQYAGSESTDEIGIPEHYPKPVSDMLMTTHNHIISFSMIFGLIGFMFYFNSIISGKWKLFLMVEPLISTILTFGSIWGIRFFSPTFAYVTIVSGTLMYLVFYFTVMVMLYELLFYRRK
jgi:hypothetical protein